LLAYANALPAQAEVIEGLEFLGVAHTIKPIRAGYSEGYIYELPARGLRPWVDAFKARGFRSRATDERFWAERSRLRAEGLVSGQKFFLKLSPEPTRAATDESDLQHLQSWLAHSKSLPSPPDVQSESNRLRLQASLPELVRELEHLGWTFADGNSTARRGPYRLQLELTGTSIHLKLSQTSQP